MRIRWRGFELPNRVVLDKETATATYGKFTIDPFERGFGTTIGNSLRRVLLSSIEGAAVTNVKIEGVQHEFAQIEGVVEDVIDILLNVKGLLVKMTGEMPVTVRLTKSGPCDVFASDIEHGPDLEIVNPEHKLCTITGKIDLKMELIVERGRGFRTALENEGGEREVGMLPIDSIFSPIRRVKYSTEDTRVGQMTNFDRLYVEIWTDGTIKPEMALVEGAKILRKHLNPFVKFFELGEKFQEGVGEAGVTTQTVESSHKAEIKAKLDMPIARLDLSVRASNCLDAEQIWTVRDLVKHTEADMLKLRNFGKTSLREIKKKLEDIGLALGTDLNVIEEEKESL